MAEQKRGGVSLPPVDQIGIVVEDIDRAVEYYTNVFGWGPFQVRETEMEGFTYKGKAGSCRQKNAFAKSGPIEIELIQALEGETPHTEFFGKKGEGAEHLRFRVEDLDSTLAELAKEGIRPIYQKRFPDRGIAFAYLDSDKVGGVIFELIEIK